MTQKLHQPMLTKSRPRSRGFALVISLSLIVLLTVLAVGLLGLSSIALRSSTRGDAMTAARANARLALMFALNDLQQLAGPDQRVTATADLAGTATGDPVAAGAAPQNNSTVSNKQKGLSSVQPGTRHWTGVWNQTAAPTATQIFTVMPAPNLLGWLVSGNENQKGNEGLTPSVSFVSVGDGGTVSDETKAVVLVGQNSAGDSADRYVSAPLVEIAATGTRAKHPAGRHAWWVGDEGVKAKLNLTAPSGSNGDLTYAELAAPRRGWETVAGFDSYPTPGSSGEASLSKVVTFDEAGLLGGSIDAGVNSPLQRSFHAATAESFGVLCDTVQGGLRLDLSAFLADPLPTTPIAGLVNPPVATANIIPTSVANKIKGPKWSALKNFHDLGASLDGGTLTVKGVPAGNSGIGQAAIGPVITDFRMLCGAKLVPSGAVDTYRVQPCIKIAVAVANPYPVPLKWDGLEIEIKNATNAPKPSRLWEASGQPAYVPGSAGEAAVLNNAVFTIPATTLPPGEARAYTNAGALVRPAGSTAKVTVPLGSFSSGASNLENSLFLDHTAVNTITASAPGQPGELKLDVREETNTTQINVELRTGATTIVRTLERFELDNAPFDVTQRKFDKTNAAKFKLPFPLQLYSFQLSQPGADYANLLPAPSQLGLRSSTMRTFADFNLQATRYRKPIISYNPTPYFMQVANSASSLPFNPATPDTGSDFTRDLAASPLRWGRSGASGSQQTVLFSPPQNLASLGQLQHADLTADDFAVSVAHQPGNAVGNSYAPPFLSRNRVTQPRMDFTITGFASATNINATYYDLSYLLNAALWDTYYFSTIPRGGENKPLNERLVKLDPADNSADLRDGRLAASRLLMDGAHNVNSTSKDAWKALLAGSRQLAHPADVTAGNDALFARSLEQLSSSAEPPTGHDADSFAGFRRLTDAQLDAVADEITRQVRLRGPFVSLSHFVNRAIVGIAQNKALGRCGALQAALDNAGSNISPDGSKNIFTDIDVAEDRLNLQADSGSNPRADLVGGDSTQLSPAPPDGIWPTTSHDENPGAVAGILADKQLLGTPSYRSEQGFRSTGIPGWITQADLLQVIGPSLTARSDTFRIRAYGETLDPTTGATVARAWCEAVVQRLPAYVHPENAPDARPAQLNPVNQKFGRRFHITAFRWLSPNEI